LTALLVLRNWQINPSGFNLQIILMDKGKLCVHLSLRYHHKHNYAYPFAQCLLYLLETFVILE